MNEKGVKYYIINLKRSPERRKSAIHNLAKFGIKNYEFVGAFDASEYSLQQLNKFIDEPNLERPLPNGAVGCAISHNKALQKLIDDSEVTCGVILEDDFLLHSNINETIKEINEEVLNYGPILLYGYIIKPLIFEEVMALNAGRSLFNIKKPLHIWSAMGYMVNKEIAAKILNVNSPVRDVADSWIKFQEWGAFEKLFIVYPFVLSHEVFDSSRSIRGNRFIDKIIQYQIPVLYQFIKSYRIKHTRSHINLINFKFLHDKFANHTS